MTTAIAKRAKPKARPEPIVVIRMTADAILGQSRGFFAHPSTRLRGPGPVSACLDSLLSETRKDQGKHQAILGRQTG